jgi:hypothetical protein
MAASSWEQALFSGVHVGLKKLGPAYALYRIIGKESSLEEMPNKVLAFLREHTKLSEKASGFRLNLYSFYGNLWYDPLVAAIIKGSLPTVKVLVENGFDPALEFQSNKEYQWKANVLHIAAGGFEESVFEYIIKQLGDKLPDFLDSQDSRGKTPLSCAASRSERELTQKGNGCFGEYAGRPDPHKPTSLIKHIQSLLQLGANVRACPQIGRDLKNSGETGRREDLKNR